MAYLIRQTDTIQIWLYRFKKNQKNQKLNFNFGKRILGRPGPALSWECGPGRAFWARGPGWPKIFQPDSHLWWEEREKMELYSCSTYS